MEVVAGAARGGSADHAGTTYWFCNPSCRERFVADPGSFLRPKPAPMTSSDTRLHTCPMHPEIRQRGPGSCPICGMALEPVEATRDEGPIPELASMSRRFRVSLVLSVPLLAVAMGDMVSPGLAARLGRAGAWLQLALAAPVVVWGGAPFFVRGW